MERVKQLASERAVVIFSRSTCEMCDSIKALFVGLGVNAAAHELNQMPGGREIEHALASLGWQSTPVVFIGGELVGGDSDVMSLHLNQSLIPKLRRAGALWV